MWSANGQWMDMKLIVIAYVSIIGGASLLAPAAAGAQSGTDDAVYYMSTQLVANRVESSGDGRHWIADVFDGNKVGTVHVDAVSGEYSWTFPGEAGSGYVQASTALVQLDAVYLPGRSDNGWGETALIQGGKGAGRSADPSPQWIWLPVVAASMCYANHQITLQRAHSYCHARGRSTTMHSTGYCGMGASYRCSSR